MSTTTTVAPATNEAPVVSIANAPAAAPAAAATSPKLEELRAKRLEHKTKARTFAPDSDEENAELLEAYKIDGLIKAELANIASAKREEELQIARNQRVAFRKDHEAALRAELEYYFTNRVKGVIPEAKIPEMNALTDATKAAAEKLDNELLSRYSASTPAKKSAPAADGNVKVAGADGATRSDILTAHLVNVANGMDDSASRKALEAAGHARSTVWHTVNNYNKGK